MTLASETIAVLRPAIRSNFFSALLLLAIVLGSCATRKQPAITQPSAAAELTDKQRLDFSFLYFEALRDKMLGNYPQAQEKLQQAVRIDPRNAAAHYELGQIYALTGKFDQAELSTELAIRFDPGNIWYRQALAERYEQTGKFEKMAGVLSDLSKEYPGNTNYKLQLAQAFLHSGKYEQALKVYDEIEKQSGISEELVLRKKNLHMRLRKPEKAVEEVRKLMKQHPEEIGYRGVLAEIYLESGQPEKAMAEYQEILRLDPANANVHFSLAEYYRSQGDFDLSYKHLKEAFGSPNADIHHKLQVLASFFDLSGNYPKLIEQAEELCQLLISAHPDDTRSHAVYGDFLYQGGKLEEALREYMTVLEADKSSYNVWNQVLLINSELKNFKQMFDLSAEALELFPTQAEIYLFNGIAAMQLKDYAKAAEVLRQGADLSTWNTALSAQFQASLGDSYNYLGKHTESDAAYEKALQYDPSNAYVMNNYAYYLSLRKAKLERARELADKCNAMVPANPSYQDTYAWVLYQMADFDNAEVWINKAIANGGIKNPTILEHKGDILWKKGKEDDALDYWKRAQEIGGSSEQLLRKISQKKLVE